MIHPDSKMGSDGPALCTWERLRSPYESRRVDVLPSGDVRAERLMGSVQTWKPTTVPLRDDTMLRLVSDVVAAAPSLPTTVAPAGRGVALATSDARPAGQPAAPFPTATGASAPSRTGSHRSNGASGEPVGVLSGVTGGAS